MRLRDNESGQTILEWLNSLPETKAVLKKHFDVDDLINDANLSMWRSGGFEDWMKEQGEIRKIEKLGELSVRLAQAAGGRMSKGFLAVAVGKIHEALEEGQSVEFDEKGKPTITGVGVDKLAKALASIAKIEQDDERLELDKSKHGLDQEKLTLDKKRFQRETAELFIEWCEDVRAKEIALGNETKDTKVAKLIQLWFGEMPANIGPAEFRKPKEAASA